MNHIRSKFSPVICTATAYVLAILFSIVLTGVVSAEDVLSYVDTGLTEYASLMPCTEDYTEGYTFSDEETSVSVGGFYKLRRIRDNVVHILFPDEYTEGASSASVSVTFDLSANTYDIDTADFAAVMFGIGIDSGTADEVTYTVEMTLKSEHGSVTSTEQVSSLEGWSAIYTETAGIEGRADTLTVNLYFTPRTIPMSVRVTMPSLKRENPDGFRFAEKYCSIKLSPVQGQGKFSMRSSTARPTDGVLSISGSLATHKDISDAEYVYFLVSLTGLEKADLSLGVTSDGKWNENARFRTGIAVNGDGTYIVPIRTGDGISDFSLNFTDCECNGSFRIESIALLVGSGGAFARSEQLYEGLSGEGDQSCTVIRDGNTVSFDGEIDRNIVKRYSNAELGFYAISALTADDITSAIEMGRMELSNMYSVSFSLAQIPVGADVSMFFIAVITEDGLLPFSSPNYAYADDTAVIGYGQTVVSSSGLYGAAPVGAFEANVSNVLVDVDISLLFGVADSDSARTADYTEYDGGEAETNRLYFDRDAMEELEADVSFYARAGIAVYLRLLFSSPVDDLTYGGRADYYLPDMSSDDARYMYAAIVRFIAKSCPTVSGIVLGASVSDTSCVGVTADTADAVLFAAEIADMARVAYNAASRYISGVDVVIPFSVGGDVSDNVVLGTLISAELERIGDFPWTAMYVYDNPEAETDDYDRLVSMLSSLSRDSREMKYSRPSAVMFMAYGSAEYYNALASAYEEQSEDGLRGIVAETTGSFWERSADIGAAAAFFSLDGTQVHSDHGYYSELKYAAGNYGSIYEAEAHRSEDEAHTGVYTIWDFSDRNYALGWLGGGGVLSCVTERSDIFSERNGRTVRVLRTVFEAGSGTAGMTLNTLEHTLDATDLSSVDFTFALECPEDSAGDSPTVVFVIGTYETRAEYYASGLQYGRIYNLSCDLTGFAERDAIDIIGVIVYAEGETVLELSSVTAISEVGGDEYVKSLFVPKNEDDAVSHDYRTAGGILLVVILVSAVAVILLTRSGDDEEII